MTRAEAKDSLLKLVNKDLTAARIPAFITVYLMRKIIKNKLAEFFDALSKTGLKVNLSMHNTMDVCGNGGDNKNTFNISTLPAFVATGAGIIVAKHGNCAVSSSGGSSNILAYFGIKFYNDEASLKINCNKPGFIFYTPHSFYLH